MATETEMLIDSMMRADRSIVDMLQNDYTFLNQRLLSTMESRASTAPSSAGLRLKTRTLGPAWTSKRPDGDLLSQPDGADDRGKWVLQQILGTPPPPPPPNVPSLKDDEKTQR